MKNKHILYIINRLRRIINFYIERLQVDLNYLVVIGFAILVMIFLSYNIYKTVQEAEKNYRIEIEEKEKLAKLSAENKELEEKLKYFQSNDAKRLLALEGFKLASPNEKLYQINKDNEDDIVYIQEENLDPINLEDNTSWWKFIFFN